MKQDSAENATTIEQVREAGGPAHPLAVWLGRGLLRGSRVSRRFLNVKKQREALTAAGAEWFGVEAEDGVKLGACRIPPREGVAPRVPVIFVPGWLEVKELHAPMAVHVSEVGHEVVLMDLRAHGGSGGKVCTFSDLETRDLSAVIGAARDRGWLADQIVTGGVSTGAVTALIHAANARSDAAVVTGVAAFAPFFDLEDAVVFFRGLVAPKLCQPWLLRGMREASLRAGFNLDRIDTEAAVRGLEIPVLFVASDPTSTASMAEQVKRLVEAKALGWKRYIEVPETNHFTLAQEAWPGIGDAFEGLCEEAGRGCD